MTIKFRYRKNDKFNSGRYRKTCCRCNYPNKRWRLDIFDKFNITFKEREGKIIFEPVE